MYSTLEQYHKKFHIWWVGEEAGDQSFAMMCRVCRNDWVEVYANPAEMVELKGVARHVMRHSEEEWNGAWEN